MTESAKTRLVRAVSVVLLIAVTLGAIVISEKRRTENIKTNNSPLPYLYSDNGMEFVSMPQGTATDVFVNLSLYEKKYDIDVGFIDFCAESETINPDGNFLTMLKSRLESGRYSDDIWEDLTGYTFSVLYDVYSGAVERDEVTVIGDVLDLHKTTLAFFGASKPSDFDGDEFEGSLAELFGGTDLTFDVGEDARFFISGGLKFAICRGVEAALNAKKSCDFVIAEAETETEAAELAAVGADVVISKNGEAKAEYIGDCVVFFGAGELFDENAVFIAVTLAVGMDPIVRLYPVQASDGKFRLADENATADFISKTNLRSENAKIDENGRIKYR